MRAVAAVACCPAASPLEVRLVFFRPDKRLSRVTALRAARWGAAKVISTTGTPPRAGSAKWAGSPTRRNDKASGQGSAQHYRDGEADLRRLPVRRKHRRGSRHRSTCFPFQADPPQYGWRVIPKQQTCKDWNTGPRLTRRDHAIWCDRTSGTNDLPDKGWRRDVRVREPGHAVGDDPSRFPPFIYGGRQFPSCALPSPRRAAHLSNAARTAAALPRHGLPRTQMLNVIPSRPGRTSSPAGASACASASI